MNKNGPEAEKKTISRKEMFRLILKWGIIHNRIPVFDNWEDEVKHYGKPYSEFNKVERAYYSEAMEKLEEVFECKPTAMIGL